MIQIDPSDRTPLYEQIINGVIRLCRLGVLQSGDALPSVRGLASQLAINPNTVQKAYSILEAKGFVTSSGGRGSFITENPDGEKHVETQLYQNILTAANEAKLMGLSYEQAIKAVNDAYQNTSKEGQTK